MFDAKEKQAPVVVVVAQQAVVAVVPRQIGVIMNTIAVELHVDMEIIMHPLQQQQRQDMVLHDIMEIRLQAKHLVDPI